ncbi:hypothetical protein O0I10_000800 [Lichtheimia ornata]|uniref:CCHC-type domain-containing protein n=1 Tax=Lichtheimia ornata TaxID=688661 RepID=A0AAD8DJD7_9FUNG|nr:uncharacterized protein O0I10_000800 [Lichtheimia ornata]KAJ8663557.1 hypothetical protein O0I10_000800 [Lichtheimia ornata]
MICHLQLSDAQISTCSQGKSPVSKDAHGVIVHRSRKHVIAEVAFNSQEACKKHLDTPISLNDAQQVYGSFPIPDEWDVVKLNLDHIPLYTRDVLCSSLITALQPFGEIVQLGIYLEQNFFTGKGFAYINVNPNPDANSNKALPFIPNELTHCITISRKDGSFPSRMHATWSKMPLYCRYCHHQGHTRIQCPNKPKPRCHHCQELGHLRKDCPVRHGSAPLPNNNIAISDIPDKDSPTFRLSKSGISKRQRTLSPPQQLHFNFSPTLSKTEKTESNPLTTSAPPDPVFLADPPGNKATSMDISSPPPPSSAAPTDDMVP